MDGIAIAVGPGKATGSQGAVLIDDFQAAYDMTRHIIGLGHERIGFIIGNPEQVAADRRLKGYVEAMRDAGLPIDDRLIVQGRFTYRSGMDGAEKLLSVDPRPTAIFASNDDMAAATVAVAHRRHLDVPNDITVCGFDDTDMASSIWPELTTIRQPHPRDDGMGRRCGDRDDPRKAARQGSSKHSGNIALHIGAA